MWRLHVSAGLPCWPPLGRHCLATWPTVPPGHRPVSSHKAAGPGQAAWPDKAAVVNAGRLPPLPFLEPRPRDPLARGGCVVDDLGQCVRLPLCAEALGFVAERIALQRDLSALAQRLLLYKLKASPLSVSERLLVTGLRPEVEQHLDQDGKTLNCGEEQEQQPASRLQCAAARRNLVKSLQPQQKPGGARISPLELGVITRLLVQVRFKLLIILSQMPVSGHQAFWS